MSEKMCRLCTRHPRVWEDAQLCAACDPRENANHEEGNTQMIRMIRVFLDRIEALEIKLGLVEKRR